MVNKPATPMDGGPEKTPLERMKELARRIVAVPKSEIPKTATGKKPPKKPD